jgi:hypothetical protein
VGSDLTQNTTLVSYLYFDKIDDVHKLSRVELPQVLQHLFSDKFMGQTLIAACRLRTDMLSRKISLDLSAIDPTELPTRHRTLSLLGPPNAASEFPGGLAYKYELSPPLGADAPGPVASVDALFDGSGLVERVKAHYLRYTVQADFSRGTAVVWIW